MLRFLDDPSVPFANNATEGGVRMRKVKQFLPGHAPDPAAGLFVSNAMRPNGTPEISPGKIESRKARLEHVLKKVARLFRFRHAPTL